MKIWTKMKVIVAITLIGTLITACFVGCGKEENKGGNSKTDIEISYWQSGLGADWLDAVIAAFEEKYPEYNVTYTPTADAEASIAPYGLSDVDTVDLYIALKLYDTDYMEPLDDILDSTIEGESKTIREKFDENYLLFEESKDGNHYTLTFGGGIMGIVYNKKMFKDAGITQLPRTTDELASVCDTFYSKKITPFCHFQSGEYWKWMSEVFFAQYSGLDYYLNTFYANVDDNGNSPSKELFKIEDGRYETLKAYEKFITSDYVLAGSNSAQHVTMQTKFISGEAAMMVNGSWLANEMSSAGSVENFEMMLTPVISSITKQLQTVKKDSDLRKLISAIDAVVSGEKAISEFQDGENFLVDGLSVSAEDWEAVRKARYTMAANYAGQSAFIPNYSNAKEGAKEFLKFLYSDEGIEVYADALHLTMPISMDKGELDTSKWSAFEKQQYALYQQTEQFVTKEASCKHEIFTDGGADSFLDYEYISRLCTNNVSDHQNAEEIWESIQKLIDPYYDNSWLQNIK